MKRIEAPMFTIAGEQYSNDWEFQLFNSRTEIVINTSRYKDLLTEDQLNEMLL